ncbi:hypothetical protein VTK26DRAFT_4584 [Humicola hyalothermophila]
MSETEKENKPETVAPAPAQPKNESGPEQSTSPAATLDQARKFLQDAQVQGTTRERKAEFLKSKGLSESDIEGLLNEITHDGQPQASTQSKEETIGPPINIKKEDRPPIVTYPEFLTKPVWPPPLVTVNGFLNTLYAFGGLSTLVYGASKYVVEPMVNNLTEARVSLHDTANQDLAKLVSKLEATVSEIPPTITKPRPHGSTYGDNHSESDAASQYDDPTELFHRDVGVQTSRPSTPHTTTTAQPPRPSSAQQPAETPTAHQTRRLTSLVASLRQVNDGLVAQTESYGDVKTVLDRLGEDLDKLGSAAHATDFVGGGGFSLYGASGRNEPDDEIRRAKENVRRVKGVLLSTRSFPGVGAVPAR